MFSIFDSHAWAGGVGIGEKACTRVDDVIGVGGKGSVRGKGIDPMAIGIIEPVGNHGGGLIGDRMADARSGAGGLVEKVARRRIRRKGPVFDDADAGQNTPHLHIGGIHVLMIDEAREHVEGVAILRVEHVCGSG